VLLTLASAKGQQKTPLTKYPQLSRKVSRNLYMKQRHGRNINFSYSQQWTTHHDLRRRPQSYPRLLATTMSTCGSCETSSINLDRYG
jgi:hypothetical protein